MALADDAGEAAPVAGVLLTGGQSRRMGRDKAGLVGPDGQTLAERTARVLSVVSGPHLEVGPGWSAFSVVTEDAPHQGPLAALAAAAARLDQLGWEGAVLVVATDLPRLTPELVAWLANHPAAGAVVPIAGGRLQPLCARYPMADLRTAARLAGRGERAMHRLLDAIQFTPVPPSAWSAAAGRPDALADADTPEEWAALGDADGRRPDRSSRDRSSPAPTSPAPTRPRAPVSDVRLVKVRPDRQMTRPDKVATEEPMQIRAAGPGRGRAAPGIPVAVTMRTPGHDFELAAGFLVTEALAAPDEIVAVGYCDAVDDAEERFNTVTVALSRPWDPDAARRDFVATAACGVCGKQRLDQVVLSCPVVGPGAPIDAAVLRSLPDQLRRAQRAFDQTGGLHAAGLFGRDGELLVLREDVGRHNAVDKVVGQRVLSRTPTPEGQTRILMVSGRVSFEITQKAAMAGIAVIAAVSAPTSLAVAAAERLGVTLAGFVRGDAFNVYAHPERVTTA